MTIRLAMLLATTATAAAVLGVPAAQAQAPASINEGTYQIAGGGYQISVERDGDAIVVVEPNKRSRYTPQPDGTFHFTNPTNGVLYGLRRIDAATIEAFKPDRPDAPPTRLARLGGAPAVVSTPLPPSLAANEPASVGDVALKYRQQALSDPDNAQTWTACAAAAHKRHLANPGEADAFGAQMATVLKQIAVDPAHSPCPDAIPEALWAGGKAPAATTVAAEPAAPALTPAELKAQAERAEQERLRQLNAQADARARAQVEDLRRQQAEYQRKLVETQAAQAQYERDRQAYEANKAQADADAAEYRRRVEEYERSYGRRPN